MTKEWQRCNRDKDLYWYMQDDKKLYAYRYRYKSGNGKFKEKSKRGFTTQKEAYRELIDIKSLIAEGNFSQVEASNLTVEKWAKWYLNMKRHEWKTKTYVSRELYVRRHIIPLIGHCQIQTLTRAEYISNFINPMIEKYRASTVRVIHDLFKQMINAAIEDDILTRNRFTRIQIKDKRELQSADNVLSSQELAIVINDMKEYESSVAYLTTLLLAHTGMRIGEASGLTWEDIDLENKRIVINKTQDRYGVRVPKTQNSIRKLPLPESLEEALLHYQLECKKSALSLGKTLQTKDFILSSEYREGLYSSTTYRNALKRVESRTDIIVRPHTFRHTYATLCIHAGMDVVTLASLLGNTPKVVLSVYAHTFEDLRANASDVISIALENTNN